MRKNRPIIDVDGDLADIMADINIETIVFATNGHQIRTVITGGKTHSSFTYPSCRYRRAQTGEGRTEFMVHRYFEALSGKLDFLPQPCRVEGRLRNTAVSAIPDYAAVAIGQTPVLGEAKRDWAEFERPDALVQQALTRKAADHLGWRYEQQTPSSLAALASVDAVDEVQAHRFAHVPTRYMDVVAKVLPAGAELTIGELAAAMDVTSARGRILACAMMVRGIVDIDLGTAIEDWSRVRAAPPRPFAWPRIRL